MRVFRMLAKLAGKTLNYNPEAGAVSKGVGYDDSLDLFRAALGRIPHHPGGTVDGQVILMAIGMGDYSGIREMQERLTRWYVLSRENRGHKIRPNDMPRIKNMALLAICEVVNGLPLCKRCEGRGETHRGLLRRVCTQCGGEGRVAYKERQRARFVGIDPGAWHRRWSRRYVSLHALVEARYYGALDALHRELKDGDIVLPERLREVKDPKGERQKALNRILESNGTGI